MCALRCSAVQYGGDAGVRCGPSVGRTWVSVSRLFRYAAAPRLCQADTSRR